MPISDTTVGLFLTIAGILWGSLTLLATDQIEVRIKANLREMERKGKVGRRRRLAANWPKQSLKMASRLWGLAVLAFGAELVLNTASPYFQIETWGNLLFITGLIVFALAGIETANLFEFIANRKFKPAIDAFSATRAGLSVCILVIDTYSEIWGILVLFHFSTLPSWVDVFGILSAISVIGSGFFIRGLWSKEESKFSRIGLWLFFSPVAYLIAIGIARIIGVGF